jgi:hypothetical protein
MFKLLSTALLVFLFMHGSPLFAKRAAPKPVPPVSYKGITYSAPNTAELMNYVLASDSSGHELFRVKVFDVPIDPKLEQNVQWVFITELRISGGSLLVKDEKGRCFAVDLTTHVVKRKYGCLF